MIEFKAGYSNLSKTSLLNRYNVESTSLLQHLEYNHNKRDSVHQNQNAQNPNNFKKEEEYEQKWQHQFLKQLQMELNAPEPTQPYYQNSNEFQYHGDRLSRQIKTPMQKSSSKGNRKEFQKFKAYAVRMKIPSFQEIGKPKIKQDKSSHLVSCKNTASSAYLKQIQELIYPKLANSLKESIKQHLKPKNYESINDKQIFKRNVKTTQKDRNLHIRKRSIKHAQKRDELNNLDGQEKNIEGSPVKTGLSINRLKKVKKNSQRSSATPYLDSRNQEYKERENSQVRHREITNKYHLHQQMGGRSPKMLRQKLEQKKLQYLQKGISFKRKEKESPLNEADVLIEKRSTVLSKYAKKASSLQYMKDIEMKDTQGLIRETPRNFLLHSVVYSKQVKLKRNQNLEESKSIGKDQKRAKESKLNKIIAFNSEDRYIRRLLLSRGWVLNPDTRSKYYHLKWVFKPLAQYYNHIREGQYINHIKNSHQLTSKNCLNKNLKAFFPQTTDLYSFYPQCFDISKPSQKQQFFEEYTKQFMMLLLRKIYHYVELNQFELTQDLREKYQNHLQNDGTYETDGKCMSFMRKKQFRNIDMQNYKSYNANFTLHINLLSAALKYWRYLRKQEEFQSEQGYHFLSYSQKELENNLGYLERYSQMTTPTFKDDSSQYFTKEFYSTPSRIAIERVVKEYVYFRRKQGTKWSVFGDRNIWIIKPCSASRGNGIYLQDNCKQILFNSKGIQSKIVQKYIQKPLLFRNPSFPHICNKKFDIRQWVLLRSIDPLQIYMFSHCYIRICSEDYNLDNINNLKSHLTNYSFNKQYFKNPAESVLDYDTFKTMLKEQYSIDYEKQIKEKVKHIIIKSIKSAQQHLNDFDKRCFSLLGYDILLDQHFNPWLLEVNMSPACQERTQWLINYLKQMGHGMLKIVLPPQYLQFSQTAKDQVMQKSMNELKSKRKMQIKESLQLKRIKTQMSHDLHENNSNLQYGLSKNLEDYWQENNKSEPQNKIQEDLGVYEEQITYDDFIKQHMPTEQQELYNEEVQEKQQTIEVQTSAQKIQDRFLQFEKEKKESSGPLMNLQSQTSLPSEKNHLNSLPDEPECLSEQQQGQNKNQLQSTLKWELICYQDYAFGKRKQIDGQLEIVGNKINSQTIKDNDLIIDQYQQTKQDIHRSVCKLQAKIKQFLRRTSQKRNKMKEEQRVKQSQRQVEIVEQIEVKNLSKHEDQFKITSQCQIITQQQIKVQSQEKKHLKIDRNTFEIQIESQDENGQSIASEENQPKQVNENKQDKEDKKQEQNQQKNEQNTHFEQQNMSKNQKLAKLSLKLNFSQITRNIPTQRKARSKSVLMDSQLDNSSIWHYSYLHTYREGINEKIQIDKNLLLKTSKSPKQKRVKNFYEVKLRDKITSLAVNAIADASASSIQEIAFQSKAVQKQVQQSEEKIYQQSIELNNDDEQHLTSEIKNEFRLSQNSNNF